MIRAYHIKHLLVFLIGLNAVLLILHCFSARSSLKPVGLRSMEVQQITTKSLPNSKLQALLEKADNNQRLQLLVQQVNALSVEKQKAQKSLETLKKTSTTATTKSAAEKKTAEYMAQMLQTTNPFRKLGLYETMPIEYYNFRTGGKFYKKTQYYKIKHTPSYCDAVDLYNLHNPENIFKNMNFVSDYCYDEKLIRKEVMQKIGNDVMPDLLLKDYKHQEPKLELAVNGTMFFFKIAMIHAYYEMNKEWACNTQMYNHIPGNGVITRKDLFANTFQQYAQNYKNKPQCFGETTFFPHAYRLNVESECQTFFEILNSEEYQQNKVDEPLQFLVKLGNGPHRAAGVTLLDDDYEQKIREQYDDGNKCGQETKSVIAQKYISNPLLLDKQNKFDFRIYMLVASVNPLIVYYHDGFLRISLSKYDKHSTEKNVHLTNTHLSKEVFKKAGNGELYDGMTEEELRDYQMWTLEDLEAYLIKTNKIVDENWVENYLRPKFKQAYAHLARMAEDSLYKSSSVFELFGLDFVIDENLNVWFIECNPSPQMVGTNERKSDFLISMAQDMFEIQYAYLRSRMKRVLDFITKMEARSLAGEELDYQELRKDFDKININKLDSEFEIRKDNGFQIIIDKNIEGPDAYFGNIASECVDF